MTTEQKWSVVVAIFIFIGSLGIDFKVDAMNVRKNEMVTHIKKLTEQVNLQRRDQLVLERDVANLCPRPVKRQGLFLVPDTAKSTLKGVTIEFH